MPEAYAISRTYVNARNQEAGVNLFRGQAALRERTTSVNDGGRQNAISSGALAIGEREYLFEQAFKNIDDILRKEAGTAARWRS
jgi:hypothetical protein